MAILAEPISHSSLAIWLSLAILLGLTILAIRRLANPISKLPGPFLTKLTILPIVYQDHIGSRTKWTEDLHRRFGPIVRLSPKEVSVSSQASIRDVFTGSAKNGYYPKAPIFNIFQHYGARNAFSSIHSESHSWRRKIVAGNYAQTAIVAKEAKHGRLWMNVGNFMDMIEREGVSPTGSSAKSIDFFSACRFFAADNITSHLFVEGSHALEGEEEIRTIIENSAEGPSDVMSYFKMEFETLHSAIGRFKALIFRLLNMEQKSTGRSRPATASGKHVDLEQSEFYGGTAIRNWGWKRFLMTREALADARIDTSLESPVGAKLAANTIQGEESSLEEGPASPDAGIRFLESSTPDRDLLQFYRNEGCASECMDQFLAGLDTVGDTLAYVLQILSIPRHRSMQIALRRECLSLALPQAYDEPLPMQQLSDIQAMPLLDAVLKETLRTYPASTTAFQRLVPTGGRILDGQFIPGDTIIGGIPTTINRDASIFDRNGKFDVEEWLPQRWIGASGDVYAEMSRRSWTFGSGGRGCIGKHLAILEMKLLLVAIYSRFSTVVDDDTPMPLSKNHCSGRTTFRDVDWFKASRGILAFHALQSTQAIGSAVQQECQHLDQVSVDQSVTSDKGTT